MMIDKSRWAAYGVEPIDGCIDNCIEDLQDQKNYPLWGGISTGFSDLDQQTTGIMPNSFNVIAGRPGMGATSLALSIALSAAVDQKRPCAIFSLAKEKRIIIQRLLALRSGVEQTHLQYNHVATEHQEQITRAADEIKSSPLFIEDGMLTVIAIKEKIDQYISIDIKPEIVIIDTLSELAPLLSKSKVSKIVKQIRALIKDTGVAVILTSGLLRKPEKRKFKWPRAGDAPAGLLCPSPDLLLMLYRENYYYPIKDEPPEIAHVHALSCRHGPGGIARLNFHRGVFMNRAS